MRDVKLKNKKIKKFAYESYVYIGNNLFLTGLDFFFFFEKKMNGIILKRTNPVITEVPDQQGHDPF